MKKLSELYLSELQAEIEGQNAVEALTTLAQHRRAVFSSSFGMEDQAITHLIATHHLDIPIFTLDTGRLFNETIELQHETIEKYRLPIKTFYPETAAIEAFVSEKGPNSFYQSVENRKACCHIRKVEPLKRALADADIWITGLRREQSPTRQNLTSLEYDMAFNVFKFHPLLEWSLNELEAFIAAENIPINTLHAQGFSSIGCAPCTRAIQADEDIRAGRWWWEQPEQKECGLHIVQGKLTRKN